MFMFNLLVYSQMWPRSRFYISNDTWSSWVQFYYWKDLWNSALTFTPQSQGPLILLRFFFFLVEVEWGGGSGKGLLASSRRRIVVTPDDTSQTMSCTQVRDQRARYAYITCTSRPRLSTRHARGECAPDEEHDDLPHQGPEIMNDSVATRERRREVFSVDIQRRISSLWTG